MPFKGDLVRARLLDLARTDPGLSLANAARLLGLDPSTAAYHARILAAEGRLIATPSGRVKALFANGDGACAWMRETLPVLREPAVHAAALALLHGPVAPRHLVRRHGLGRGRAERALRRLQALGAAEAVGGGVVRLRSARADCLQRAPGAAGLNRGR